MIKMLKNIFIVLMFVHIPLFSRDVLFEFKGAGFFPTDSCTRNIYGNGAALVGTEATFALCENKNWYGFASLDYLNKKGCSVALRNPTRMDFIALALGVKYFVPFCYGDFYVGLGFQPVYLKTLNCSTNVLQNTSKWGFGGIAKVGTYFKLPCNFFVDLFLDYSFARVNCDKCFSNVVPLKANLDGAIFGIGLGYRFN